MHDFSQPLGDAVKEHEANLILLNDKLPIKSMQMSVLY